MSGAPPDAVAFAEGGRELLLAVDHLHGGYNRIPVLDGISFTLAQGEFVGILGHNGMGKTTLLRTMMGYLPSTGGTLRFAGDDLTHASTTIRARSGMSYVPQGREIFPALSVYDNLRMGCLRNAAAIGTTIERILELFPRLKAYLDRPGGALSGGEQQLLALARCLCAGPRLVLLDEPTEGIQPSIIEELIDLLHRIQREWNLTVLLVEQNLSFIAALSDRAFILRKGRIVRDLSPVEMRDHRLIAEFTGMA